MRTASKRAWSFILLSLIGGFFLFDASQTPKGERALAASVVIDIQSFIQKGLVFAAGEVSDHMYAHQNALESQKEVTKLKRSLAQMNHLKIEMEQLREENRVLRRWSNFPNTKERFFPLGANVVGRKISQMGRVLRIDQGKNAGLKKGDGVVNVDHHVVGRILWVSDNSADVMLVTDPASTIDGVIERSRARGLIRGMGKSDLVVEDFDRLMDVRENDVLLTAGTNRDFPMGLPIAKIKLVIPPHEGVYLKAKMQALVNLKQIESVWVLRRTHKTQLPRLGQDLVETIEWETPLEETSSLVAQKVVKEELPTDAAPVLKEQKLVKPAQKTEIPVKEKVSKAPSKSAVMEIISVKKTMKVVAPSGVKIRSGPGIEHWVVETKYKGEQLYATGEVKGKDWIRISLPTGVQGYVFAPLLSEVAQASLNEKKE